MTETARSAIAIASVVGGILGLCVTFICIVGLIVKRNKRRKYKVRKGVFTKQPLPIVFNRYVATSVINIIHLIIGIDKEVCTYVLTSMQFMYFLIHCLAIGL